MGRTQSNVTTVALLVFVAMIFAIIGRQSQRCDQRGGKLVRGVFWFTCVQGGAK